MCAQSVPSEAPSRRPFTLFGIGRPVVSVIELRGAIGDAATGRRGLCLSRLAPAIELAFKPSRLAAVALSINSPGGSPVQARMIHDAIRRRADKKKTPVYSFIEDVGASGGYLLALAGDEIYADASSVIGSIGVISAGFGFVEAIARIGVERRVHTAGADKGQLDPFRREKPDDVARLHALLDDMHAEFIGLVKQRRGGRLGGAEDIFSGAFWTAGAALDRGLIDGKAHLGDFIEARFGENVRVRRFSPDRGSLLRRLTRSGVGAMPEQILDGLEERALWSRYGR